MTMTRKSSNQVSRVRVSTAINKCYSTNEWNVYSHVNQWCIVASFKFLLLVFICIVEQSLLESPAFADFLMHSLVQTIHDNLHITHNTRYTFIDISRQAYINQQQLSSYSAHSNGQFNLNANKMKELYNVL